MNIRKLQNIEDVFNYLKSVKSDAEYYSSKHDFENYFRRYCKVEDTIRRLENQGYDDTDLMKKMANAENYDSFSEISKLVVEAVERDIALLSPYQYERILINGSYYKLKSAYYSENDQRNTILRLATVSCHTKEELNALVASIQRGIRFNIKGQTVVSLKAGYACQFTRISDENLGDGYHGVIYQTDNTTDKVVMVFGQDNPVDVIYQYVENNIDKTGLIPEWASYLINRLSDDGLLVECEGFSYSEDKTAPTKILIISNQVTNEVIMKYKMEGIKTEEIELPVTENVMLSTDATFLDLVEQYVIPNLQDEVCDYNIGEPISASLKKAFYKGNKKCYLYPRQQVIAQGVVNAIKNGKKNLFLGCGMGVGKSVLITSSIAAHAIETNTVDKTRVLVYIPGHLQLKWKREWTEYLSAHHIKPTFYDIERFTDIKNIPKKGKGFEIFIIPKDKAKRSYMQEFNVYDKYNRASLLAISNFKKSLESKLEEDKEIIVEKFDKSITYMRLAATRVSTHFKKPVVLYKEVVNEMGKVIAYKVCISSNFLRKALKKSSINVSYDFLVEDLNSFVDSLDLEKMSRDIKSSNGVIQNGLTCPDCGGFIFDDPLFQFNKEKWLDNYRTKPGTRSSRNNYHKHYNKADGTQLMAFEVKAIRNEKVKFVFSEKKMANPYIDMDGTPIVGEDLIKVKAGKYTGEYQIVLKMCKHKLWGAISKKGYNTANVGDMMLKKFGKGSFTHLVTDEAHLFQNLSNQSHLYSKLCKLSKYRHNLTGTLTNGKSSSLFYMFYALFPHKMKQMGYKYSDVSLWVEHYGRRREVEKEYRDEQYNKTGVGRRSSTGFNEIPGFSPLLYSNFLADIMINRTIEDMAIPMPPLKYIAHKVEMDEDLRAGYDELKDDMITFMKQNKGIPLGGSYIHNLMAYPDYPVQEDIYAAGMFVARPTEIKVEGRLLNKEQKLIDTIKKELQLGRRTLVTSIYSGEKGVSKRLVDIIRSQGIDVIELTSSIPLEKREAWIQKQYDNGISVIITNPRCVETGLDIYGYPNIYIYESGWDIKTLRQVERRSWRIGQQNGCKVFYSYYVNSIQEDCIKLVGSKKKSSLMLEGKFDEDFLSTMSEAGDSGARVLFKMLEGKVTLKESELDAFQFEEDTEDTEIPVEVQAIQTATDSQLTSKKTTKKKPNIGVEQTTLFTITDADMEKLSSKVKKKNKLVEGQMTFLALA